MFPLPRGGKSHARRNLFLRPRRIPDTSKPFSKCLGNTYRQLDDPRHVETFERFRRGWEVEYWSRKLPRRSSPLPYTSKPFGIPFPKSDMTAKPFPDHPEKVSPSLADRKVSPSGDSPDGETFPERFRRRLDSAAAFCGKVSTSLAGSAPPAYRRNLSAGRDGETFVKRFRRYWW